MVLYCLSYKTFVRPVSQVVTQTLVVPLEITLDTLFVVMTYFDIITICNLPIFTKFFYDLIFCFNLCSLQTKIYQKHHSGTPHTSQFGEITLLVENKNLLNVTRESKAITL